MEEIEVCSNQVIYCYFEEQKDALDTFITKYNNSIIYIFSSVIESCDGNLFYCLGDIINNYIEKSDEKVWFATDIKELFDIVKKLYSSIFENIIYIEQNNKKKFNKNLDINELINYFLNIQKSKLNALFMRNLWELKENIDLNNYIKFLDELDIIKIEKESKLAKMWCCFCNFLLLEINNYDNSKKEYFYFEITLYSILMKLNNNVRYTNSYIQTVMSYKKINEENLYFVWNQFKKISLIKMAVFDKKTRKLLDEMYDKCYNSLTDKVKEYLLKIPLEIRNKNVVMIFTIQFLNITHAPTRTVIERAKALSKLGKKVIIVNTSEQYNTRGCIPMYKTVYGTVLQEYNNVQTITIGDIGVKFFQLNAEYSIQHKIQILANLLQEIKPYYILSIGTGSMLADLCGNIVPCASMALAFSTLPKTKNKMKILGRKLYPEEEKEFKDTDIIESKFTFELKKQKKKFLRREMNLPKDKFILVIVGIRLQYEISFAFIEMLEKVCKNNCYVVFAGVMDNYNELMEEHSTISENSSFIGYCDDILALMEICDLYVNPNRLGGGFSVIEAFSKGKPGIYLKKGDVYTAGGEEFAVNDFNEMEKQIIKYKNDKNYYNKMSELAKDRARVMTSSIEAMADIDRQICQKIEEKYW